MELRESIESINNKLLKEFGRYDDRPNFRVVFSEDQYEKRFTDFTDEGLELIHPEVRELPKYKQYIHEKYILERLVPVQKGSDLTTRVSYEPAWVFQDKYGNYLPPFFDGCKFVIESIFAAMDKKGTHVKYRDPEISEEVRAERLKKVEEELFGNETDVSDALAYGYGVSLSGAENTSSEKEEKKETVN